MNLKFLWAIVGVTTFTLGAFSWHYLQLTPIEDPLYEYALLTGGLAIGLGIFWVPYSLLIAYMVVPKADAWIAPHQPFDNLIERHYRALDYSGACTFRWINRRTLDFDCRILPAEIRHPLVIHFIMLMLFCIVGFGSGAVLWVMGKLP